MLIERVEEIPWRLGALFGLRLTLPGIIGSCSWRRRCGGDSGPVSLMIYCHEALESYTPMGWWLSAFSRGPGANRLAGTDLGAGV